MFIYRITFFGLDNKAITHDEFECQSDAEATDLGEIRFTLSNEFGAAILTRDGNVIRHYQTARAR